MRRAWWLSALLVLHASPLHATNVTEFPDNGSEQLARGGAWVARASDPVAVFYNPAGLAGQRSSATLQMNLVHQQTCFSRAAVASDTTRDKLPGGTFPNACSSQPFALPPNPVLALAIRLSPKLTIAGAFLTPSHVASSSWAEQTMNVASPQRYMLLDRSSLFAMPTIGFGYEVLPNLRLGASFQWGIASMSHSFAAVATNSGDAIPAQNDLRIDVSAVDPFVPGGTIGALYSFGDFVDFGAWMHVSKPIQANGKIRTHTSNGITGDTSEPNCSTQGMIPECKGGAVHVQIPVPVELKLGARLHKARGHWDGLRDPLWLDLWDLEVNLTWAHDSDYDKMQIRTPPYDIGSGTLPINGLMGQRLPSSLDMRRGYRDVIGVRVGGDWAVVPGKLALRAGTFFETGAQDTRYQSVDNMAGARIGVSAGATWRIGARGWRGFELSLGYMHMFVLNQSNQSANGNGAISIEGPNYKTPWPVNIGTITSSLDAINLGLGYRF